MKNGMFRGLNWDCLQSIHQENWHKLQAKYKLSPAKYDLHSSLDQIAADCIQACLHLFFPPQKDFEGLSHSFYLERMDNNYRLMGALSDHLIITFSHRFYCDNLQAKDINDYLKIVYACTDEGRQEQKYSRVEANGKKHTFIRDQRKTFYTWQDDVQKAVELYKVLLPNSEFSLLNLNKELLLPPNWPFSLTMSCARGQNPFSVIENSGTSYYRFQRRSRRSDKLQELTDFFTNNKLLTLLFHAVPEDYFPVHESFSLFLRSRYAPHTMSLCTASALSDDRYAAKFAALTYNIAYIDAPLPSQKYQLINSERKVSILPHIQTVFNNYLVERNFHGYILTYILHYANAFSKDLVSLGLRLLLGAMNLQAVFLQPCMVDWLCSFAKTLKECSKDNSTLTRNFSQASDVVQQWNIEALPVLEEFFLWNIFENFELDSIPEKIEASFGQTDDPFSIYRCDRLNLYRLINNPRKEDLDVREPGPNERYLRNSAVTEGYSNIIANAYYKEVHYSADTSLSPSIDPFVFFPDEIPNRTVFD